MKNKNFLRLTASRRIFATLLAASLLIANNSRAQIISNGTPIGTQATTMILSPVSGTGTLFVNSDSVIRNASPFGSSISLRILSGGTYYVTNSGLITNSGTTAGHQAVDITPSGVLDFSFVNTASGVMAINPSSIYEVFRAAQAGAARTGTLTNYGLIEGQGSGAVVTAAIGRFTVHNEGTIRGGIGFWGGTYPGGTSLTINQVAGEITSNFENSLYTAANTTTVNVSGGSMTKDLVFDGNNSVSAVNLSGGTINGNLLFNKAASTNTVTVTGGSLNGNVSFGGGVGTLTFNRTDNYTYSRVISGNGALVQAGAGTTTLSGANTYTRGTTISNGATLVLDGGGVLGGGTYAAAISNDGTFIHNGTARQTLNGVISGTGAVVKSGSGDLVLGGNNTYSGGTWLNNGLMNFGPNSLGSGAITIGAAGTVLSSLSTNATLANNIVFSNFNGMFYLGLGNNSSLVLNGTISGGGPNVLWRFAGGEGGQNTGILTLNGTNSFAGTLEVWRGPLILGNSQAAGNALIQLDSNLNPNGSLQFSSSFAISNNIRTINTGEPIGVAAGRSNALAGVISGNGSINKVGAGSLFLFGNNTFSGGLLISAGSLYVGDGGTTGTLGAGRVSNNASLFLNRSDSYTVANAISGSGSLTKNGAGTVTLTADNSYTGGTVVNAGTLVAQGFLANNASNTVTVNNGGTFVFARNFGNTFGIHTANILTPMVINAGGLVTNSGSNFFSSLGPITLNGGTLAAGTVGGPDGYSYALKGTVTVNSDSTISGPGISLGAGSVTGTTFNVTSNATLTVSSGLTNGAGAVWPRPQPSSLTKSGVGTLLLTGTNTYTGDTTVSGGSLVVGGSGVLGRGNYDADITLTSAGSTLVIDTTANQSLGGIISGAGSLVKTNAGTLTISGMNNSYMGTTTIADGTLVMNGDHYSSAADPGAYNVTNAGTLAGNGYIYTGVEGNGTISPGSPGQIGMLNIDRLTNFTGLLNINLDGGRTSMLSLSGETDIRNTTVKFSEIGAPLSEETYIFLSTCGDLIGPFLATSNQPTGYTLRYDFDDGVAFLQTNSATATVTALNTNGVTAVIGNGTNAILPFQVLVYNGLSVNLTNISSAGNGTNVVGGFGPSTLATNDSDVFSGLTFSNGIVGQTNTATFNVVLDGVTNQTTFDVLVYDHASNSVSGTNVTFAPVHRNAGLVTSTNSITVSNTSGGVIRAVMSVTNVNTNNFITIDTATSLAQGDSAELFGELNTELVTTFGRVTNNAQLIAYDDMDLAGASTNVGATGVQVISYVYTGQGVWTSSSGGNWTDFANWEEEGGTPGLDGPVSVNDTALFDTNGSGSVTLSGTNAELLSVTFSNASAPYVLSGTGTLVLAASGSNPASINTLAGSHTISNQVETGSDITFSNALGTELALAGGIAGAWGIVKSGAGTTILTGPGSYTGTTTISGGTLVVTNGALGSGDVNVANGVLKPIDLAGLTINSDLSFGAAGSYVWTLLDNTTSGPGTNFTAPLVLADNKLSVADGAEFQMLFGTNVDATNNFWDADDDLTNTWTVMTGTDLAEGTMFRPVFAEGSVTNGFNPTTFFFRVTNNTLTLNFTPGLIVFPGPDEFLPGVNYYPWVVFEPNAELEVPVGVNVVIKQPITISNNSTVVINGQFTSQAGTITLENGSSLGGNGTINGNLISAGLVSPGNSPGTLSVAGNWNPTPSGSFLLEAASLSNFDRMNVSGAAVVDGTLTAVGFGGNNLSPGDRYQFLTADGGISGEFDTITVPAGLRGRFLISGVNNTLGTLLIAPATYTSMAITPNQFNAAAALDNFIGAGGDRGTVSAALDTLTASQYPAAFEQVMPSQYASLPSMAFNVANALNSSMFQQLWVIRINGKGFNASGVNMAPMQAEMGGTDDMGVFAINPSKDTKWSSFVDGNGVFANASSTGSVQNYRSQSGGVSTGAAYSWTDAFATGVYVGYQGLQAEYDSGRTIDNAVRFGVFGTYDIEDFYFNALVGGAYHGYTVNRYINFGGLNRTATGRPGAGEFDLALGTGYDFDIGNFSWGPFTTLQYTYMAVQGFTEAGADSLNLDVDPYNSSSLLYTLGAQAAYNWKVSDKVIITPTAFAGWQHEFLQNGYTINSTFATGGPAAPFNYNTSSPARDNFYGGVGVTVGVGESWQATFIYSASAANQDNSSQNLYLGLGYKF